MKTKYFFITVLLSVVLVFNSCEDKLDIPQQGVTSVEDFYKTDNDALEAVANVYSTWRGQAFTNFFLKNMLSDDMLCGGGSRGDNTQYEQLNEFTFGPTNSTISGAFSGYYALIYSANLVINNFKTSSDIIDRAVAEAKVARAWAYFNLVTLWGSVPLVLKELSPSEYQQKNGDVNAIWAQVEEDLREAVASNKLPEKAGTDDKTVGARLTRQAAMTYLGKVLLWEGKYSEASDILKQVISSGKYELIQDYGSVLRTSQDFGPENVFEFNSVDDSKNAFNQGTTMFGLMIGWRADHLNMLGYWSGMHPLYPNGWGFGNPTKDLYNAFVEMEGVDGYRLNNTIKNYNQVAAMGITINAGSNLYGSEGYFDWKFRFLGSEVVTNSWGWSVTSNFRDIRYSEVLLLAAEASLKAGDESSALGYVNQVRSRAHLTPLSALTLNDIKKEKRLELCFEQVRYQDLIRWGDAASVLAGKGKNIPVFYGLNQDGTFNVSNAYSNSSYGFKTGKNELLPIPEQEMNVNQNIKQNAGW